MDTSPSEIAADARLVALFLGDYYKIWQTYFPGLNKRAHWYAVFAARRHPVNGVPCRSLHRTLYGAYGTDIRTCIERVKDCERDGFVRILNPAGQPCQASPACSIVPTPKLHEQFEHHCNDTIHELRSMFGDDGEQLRCNPTVVSGIFNLLGAFDQKWRDTTDQIVRQKGLTPAHINDAMDHLVTYQYWAIVMLLWRTSAFGNPHAQSPAMVVDEINSRMWEVLGLGHLAIKERVSNLVRWGFLAEQTVKKHKAVRLTDIAGAAISAALAETKPLLRELYDKLIAEQTKLAAAASA